MEAEQDKAKRKRPRRKAGAYGYLVPEAGAMIGLSRSASFRAAARGEIPTIKTGRTPIVPKALWLQKLGVEAAPTPAPPAPVPGRAARRRKALEPA
jgi:hypothetical protein